MSHSCGDAGIYRILSARATEDNGSGDVELGPPLPCLGESDTIELIITLGKSVSLYSTIYILCKVSISLRRRGRGWQLRRRIRIIEQ